MKRRDWTTDPNYGNKLPPHQKAYNALLFAQAKLRRAAWQYDSYGDAWSASEARAIGTRLEKLVRDNRERDYQARRKASHL